MSKSLVSGHLTSKLPLSHAKIILLNCQAGCVLYMLRVGAYMSQNIRVPVARKPWALGSGGATELNQPIYSSEVDGYDTCYKIP